MNIQEHTTPERLERYSFLWSEIRLIIAAVALFMGGVPPIIKILGSASGLTYNLLNLSWIISGAAAAYLLYRWWQVRTVFGGTDRRDMLAFFVMVVSGINLGLTGILSRNIGMGLASFNQIVFLATAILYLVAAYYLYKRWKAHGERIF